MHEVKPMQKMRTSRNRIKRGLRQGVALFLVVVGVWLAWLTGDPAAAVRQVSAAVDDTQLAVSLLAAELGGTPQTQGLSCWDRLVLAQSSLLTGTVADAAPVPTEVPELSPPPMSASPTASAPLSTSAPEDIIPKTMVAGTSAKYVTSGRVTIYNHTDYELDIEALLASAPELERGTEGPQILIFHSHATEAYTMDGTDIYEESDSYRTLDHTQNMVRIGAEMKAIFEAAGLEVIHDTTLYDYPSYNEAYNRSGEGVAKWLKEYPSIQLVLDVHRDALAASDGTIYKTVAGTVEGCAQVMLVMGSDAMGQKHPNWKTNLALAVGIQDALAAKWSTLARPLVLRTSRFNQHQSTGMILVEIGTHGNTLQEGIMAARLFARTVADMMTK